MYKYYVYILECSDRSYYTGVTNNINERFNQHQMGLIRGCYTHKRRPVKLVNAEEFKDIYHAMSREKQIKGWTRKKKKALIDGDEAILRKLSKSSPSASSG